MSTAQIAIPPLDRSLLEGNRGWKEFFMHWTPRAIAAGIGGYCALGIAYDVGLMALIDRIAIVILKSFFGYAGMGAAMPHFQWYSAWGVRAVFALGAGLLYDAAAKVVVACKRRVCGER